MKKRFVFIAAAVAGCAVLLSGCSSSNSVSLVPLNSNWYAITTFKGFQPTFTEEYKEEIVYDVKFEPSAGNSSYSVEYADGTYTTEFYTTEFCVSDFNFPDEFKSGYPEKNPIAYYYKTVLDIPSVTFTVGGESQTFDGDKQETECYFLACENYLQPLYSKMTIKSTTPANQSASSIGNSYKQFDRIISNFYKYDGSEVYSVISDNLDTASSTKFTQELDASTSLFDNMTLDVVIRAMSNLSSSLSQAISLYSADAGISGYTLAGSETALTDAESEKITEILSDNGLYTHKTDLAEGENDFVNTVAVSVTYNGSLPGVSQTYWYAAIDNKLNNTTRATMVKLSVPVPYALGTLNYTLSKVKSTLWND